ncbi:TRIM71 [Mytilus coruscus]|uniref:TRIM71 n=1 Tax=Mytilus coruscus TaxID=42192 RepID=A0A6J8EU86_MYTCO|nr:TRIM71 [Mytilus coruscus]
MEQNDEIEKTINKLGSLESLGKVTVVKTHIPMKRETDVKREAQVETRERSNIKIMTMKIETKMEINIGTWIRNIICLMDGSVIAITQFGTVNFFTVASKIQKHFLIPGEAYSVTQINQYTIALTYPGEKAIKIFNMENTKVTKVIKLDKVCRGLSFANNSLAVGLDRDEIRIIDLEGNTLKSIQVESVSYLFHLVYCNDRVTYSDSNGKAVCSVDESGKQIWQYKQDLTGPRGLCTDTYGNIIVADGESKRIIVISKDGQGSQVLIN